VPDRRLVEEVAADLGTRAGLVEKDWHVVRAIGVIAGVDTAGMMPAFSGGTSLSKGWELIKRFSEDIDFKVGEPSPTSASRARRERTAYRERILEALHGAGFQPVKEPLVRDVSRFFSANLAYEAEFGAGQGLRPAYPHRVSFEAPALPAAPRPIRSLIAMAQREPPEVASFRVWIRSRRQRTSSARSPGVSSRGTAREPTTTRPSSGICTILPRSNSMWRRRRAFPGSCWPRPQPTWMGSAGDAAADFTEMLRRLETDPLLARGYEEFVRQVSFAGPGEAIDFAEALAACTRLVKIGLPE
jgi:hypothetical protein